MTLTRQQLARRELVLLPAAALAGCAARPATPIGTTSSSVAAATVRPTAEPVRLPPPQTAGGISLTEVLARRRSVRTFTSRKLTLAQLGQLMWAAQGITHDEVKRASPSAAALYPLELYALTASQIMHYNPADHRVGQWRPFFPWRYLVESSPNTREVEQAAAVFALTGVINRTAKALGDQARDLVQLEAGHAAENMLLQAVALGLGAIPLGLFTRNRIAEYLALPTEEEALYLVAVGHPD